MIFQFAQTIKHRAPRFIILFAIMPVLFGCTQADVPSARNLKVPAPTMADERPESINEQPDSVLYLPLGSDVLVPEASSSSALPSVEVGPFELRSETLAGALQLILADYQIPLAFETDEGLTRTITVSNLRGSLNDIVDRVCGLADLYCAFEDGTLVVKDTQTFTVTIPPIGGDTNIISAVAGGVEAVTGATPIVDEGTRTIIYEATNRTAKLAERYFQRIRANTALIIFEVYIWEVTLESNNNLGIDWTEFGKIGGAQISLPAGAAGGIGSVAPVSIGLPSFGNQFTFNTNNLLEFLSTYGAVKTISQPQLTVLSGAEASLRAADTLNFVSSVSRSVDNGDVTVSTETDSVDTGFTLTIASNWDNSTIYGNINIELQEFQQFDDFDANGTTLRLPRTAERELSTRIRIRPGDSLLIAGLVRERDELDESGPGFNRPLLPTGRTSAISNTELVFLLKPRVIVYTAEGSEQLNKRSSIVVSPQSNSPNNTNALGRPAPSFPQGSLSTDMLDPSQ